MIDDYIFDKKKKFCGIYALRNLISGKIYIGQSKDLRQRRSAHISLAKHVNKDSQIIHKAIIKYGIDNFIFFPLIAEENVSRKQLNLWEKEMIEKFKSNGFELYNIAEGGYAGDLGKEIRKKISEKLKGRIFTKEWREKLSKAQKGRKRSLEAIEKSKITYKIRLENGEYKNFGPNNLNKNKVVRHPEKSHQAWNKGLKGKEYKKHFKNFNE